MIRFIYQDKQCSIVIRHQSLKAEHLSRDGLIPKKSIEQNIMSPLVGRRYTCVEIVRGNQTIAKGCAVCHPNDNFNKIDGRKLAMSHAMNDMTVTDKRFRKAIWEAFLKQCKVSHSRPKIKRIFIG